MKTLTCPLGQNQILKVEWGEKCEDPHTPLGAESTTKSRWGRNVKTLTHPFGQNQLLKVDGEKCEDPHMPLGVETTTKSRWGRNVKTLTQVLKVDGGEM